MTLVTQPQKPQLLIIGAQSLLNRTNAPSLMQYVSPVKQYDPALATVFIPAKGKVKKSEFVGESQDIINYCESAGVSVIAVTQADYYKFMTGRKTFEGDFGLAKPGVGEFERYTVVPVMNHNIISNYPQKAKLFAAGIRAMKAVMDGDYTEAEYKRPKVSKVITDPSEAIKEIKERMNSPVLGCDIETTGLSWYADDMLTLSFGRSEEDTVCIAIHPKYHDKVTSINMKKILNKFFRKYEGRWVFHNGAFDVPFVIHEIMRDRDFSVDFIPLVNMLDLEDTMLMAYNLYNSTERPQLSLKALSKARYGEYDSDIDQRFLFKAPLSKVGEYNNIDVAATMYLYNKYAGGEMKSEGVQETYEKTYRPLMKFIIKMKMEGLRIDLAKTTKYASDLSKMIEEDIEKLRTMPAVQEATEILLEEAVAKRNATLKTKVVTADEMRDSIQFNPNSGAHKRILLFEVLGYPVEKLTDTGAPSVDAETMSNLRDYADTQEKLDIIESLEEIASANKVVSTYLTGFRDFHTEVSPGDYRIFGDFLLHGTVSGRLSSRNPKPIGLHGSNFMSKAA
jgi:hypothetical protein